VTVWYVKKKKITNIFTLIVNITKKYWQEVKKMTTNLYIDLVFNLESLVFGYKIYDQAYFDLNLLITLIFFLYIKPIIFQIKNKKKLIYLIFLRMR
jgi:hypothetical protein